MKVAQGDSSQNPRQPAEQPSSYPNKRVFIVPVVSRVKDPAGGPDKDQVIAQPEFIIDPHYTPIKAIGRGAYGVVSSAVDSRTGEKVAIKKIINAFSCFTDAIRTLREIKLLRTLRHENMIRCLDVMIPHETTDFQDLYVVYDLMDTDMNQVIRSPQNLSDDHFKYFVYQLLRATKYLHSASVIHRDIKPHNLLLSAGCDLKVCDFGLARTMAEPGAEKFMTEYVQTRWYRAPELLLGCDNYGLPIDMWSIGCIIGELLGRRALFPGKDWEDQLRLILQTLGMPTEEDVQFINNQRMRDFVLNLPREDFKGFKFNVDEKNALAVDLMKRMLTFDPTKRITVHEALRHPYLAQLHDESKEPVASTPFIFDFKEEEVSETNIRQYVIDEIKRYKVASS